MTEYAAIYFGIIVGLALTNILTSIHKLVEAGSRVRWHWLAPVSTPWRSRRYGSTRCRSSALWC